MSFSVEKKILIGFILNLLVVIASGFVFILDIIKYGNELFGSIINWIELSLFLFSIVLLIIVFFIIRAQLRAKNISLGLLDEHKKLLQSILDNTSNSIFIKKLNGEYLLVNKQFEALFNVKGKEVIGKIDHDFLPKEIADSYRNTDIEVVKVLHELKSEETIQQSDGPHTYIAVKFPLYDNLGRVYAIGGISTDITERNKIEESSKAADKFFSMFSTILVIASKDKFIKINPKLCKTLGYSEEELLKQSFFKFILPEDFEITRKEIEKLQAGIPTVKFENRWICKDGTIKWLSWTAASETSTGLLLASASDVTDWKEKQKDYDQKIIINEQQIQTIFDSAPDPIIIIDYKSKILKWNPKAESVFGWKASEVLGKPITEFMIPPRFRDAHMKGIEKFMSIGTGPVLNKTTEIAAATKDGKEIPIALSISPAKMGEQNVFIGFARDITGNKKIMDELHEQKEMIRLVLENIAEGVVVANADKKVIMINNAANTILGVHEGEQISMSLMNHFELFYPDEKTVFPAQNLPIEHAYHGEQIDDVDVVLLDPIAKEKKRVLISGKPLVSIDDKVAAAVVTIKDITKYKQIEAELKETELKYRKLIGFNKSEDKVV